MKCHNIPLPTDYIASRHAGFVRSFQPNICHYVSAQCHGSLQIRFPIIPRTWYLSEIQSVVQRFLIEFVHVLAFVIIVDGINTCIASFAHMMEKCLWSHQLCCWYITPEYCSLRTGKTYTTIYRYAVKTSFVVPNFVSRQMIYICPYQWVSCVSGGGQLEVVHELGWFMTVGRSALQTNPSDAAKRVPCKTDSCNINKSAKALVSEALLSARAYAQVVR